MQRSSLSGVWPYTRIRECELWCPLSAPCKPELASLTWPYPSEGSYFSRQLSKAWLWNVWGKNYKTVRVEPEKKNPLQPREVLSWSIIRLNQGFETWNRVCVVHEWSSKIEREIEREPSMPTCSVRRNLWIKKIASVPAMCRFSLSICLQTM